MRALRAMLAGELRAEVRGGEVLFTTIPFAAAGLLVAAIAVGADTPLLRRIGAGMFWTLVLLFGSLVAVRQTLSDRPARRDLLVLLGVDPVLQWMSRATAAALLLIVFEASLLPVMVVLYDPPMAAVPAQLTAALLTAIGIGALGTWAADLAASDRARTSLVPLIVTPLSLPLAIAGVQLSEGAVYGAPVWPWLVLALTAVLVIVLVGLLSARALQEVRT